MCLSSIDHKDGKISLLYINITEECTHALLVSVRWSSKLPEINKLYYKYKSNIETILLHPEISSPIAAGHTKLL
jgi:hypothetical protein